MLTYIFIYWVEDKNLLLNSFKFNLKAYKISLGVYLKTKIFFEEEQ